MSSDKEPTMSETLNDVFYFGCWNEPGHYLHNPAGSRLHSERTLPHDFPCAINVLDTGFLPPNLPETEGRATVAHLNGWTILAFWDRSVDSRGKCNSAFVMRDTLDFDDAVLRSRAAFPNIYLRFKFQVHQE